MNTRMLISIIKLQVVEFLFYDEEIALPEMSTSKSCFPFKAAVLMMNV